jgi:hypothetical protein
MSFVVTCLFERICTLPAFVHCKVSSGVDDLVLDKALAHFYNSEDNSMLCSSPVLPLAPPWGDSLRCVETRSAAQRLAFLPLSLTHP